MDADVRAVNRRDIEACLGPVSDDLARRIVASGATIRELALAVREVGLGMHDGPSGRVGELCSLLAEELGSEFWPDY